MRGQHEFAMEGLKGSNLEAQFAHTQTELSLDKLPSMKVRWIFFFVVAERSARRCGGARPTSHSIAGTQPVPGGCSFF
jgi:hypothetical protein